MQPGERSLFHDGLSVTPGAWDQFWRFAGALSSELGTTLTACWVRLLDVSTIAGR